MPASRVFAKPWFSFFTIFGVLTAVAALPSASIAAGTWQQIGIGPLGFCDGIIASPVSPYAKYVRTDVGGAYVWNSSTSTWSAINDNLGNAGIVSIAADPTNATTVYIATKSNGVNDIYKSTNQGSTWTALGLRNAGAQVYMGPNDNWRNVGERLAIDPNGTSGGPVIYFGSQENGLFRSTNGGSTWTAVTGCPAGTSGEGISFIAFDPTRGNSTTPSQTIYAGVMGLGVYVSTDGGTTWGPVSGGPGSTYIPERAAVVASTGEVYVTYMTGSTWTSTTGGAIYSYKNGVGTNVTPSVDSGCAFCGISVDPSNSNRIIAAIWAWANDMQNDILTSTNGGSSWSQTNMSITQPSWYLSDAWQNWNCAVLIDPANPAVTWETNGMGVLSTSNNNASPQAWAPAGTGIEELCCNEAVKVPGGPLLLPTEDMTGFSLTSMTGYTGTRWAPADLAQTSSVSYSTGNPAFVVRMGWDESTYAPLLYTSTDYGQSWTAVSSAIPSDQYGVEKSGVLTVSSVNTSNLVWIPCGPDNVLYSSNGGATWSTASGSPVNGGAYGSLTGLYTDNINLAADNYQGYDNFYLSDSTGDIYRSTNSGATWTIVNSGSGLPWYYTQTLKCQPGTPGTLWISWEGNLGNSAYRSTDGGATWTALPRFSNVETYGFGAAAPGYSSPSMYVFGTLNGVTGYFESDNATSNFTGATWTNIGLNVPEAVAGGLDGDLGTYGAAYAATDGRGAFYYTAAAPPAATATPVISLASGSYNSAQTVSLSDSTSGAVIYYTNNGSTPTASSSVYTGAITVSASQTLEAVAIAPGFTLSSVASAVYTLPAFNCTASVSPSTVTHGSTVTIKATFTDTGVAASGVVTDVEIRDGSYNSYYQNYATGVTFTSGQSRTYTYSWSPAKAGTYYVWVMPFNASWSAQYLGGTTAAATITVK